ncbi:DUF302 domain-containing protein [Luteibacter yeojuensis]|nr:DUF302 domain-containing protein [Luteibacter yeojuensis]
MIKAGLFLTVATMAMGAEASPPPRGPADLVVSRSTSDVASTQARAKAALEKLGVPVFATFDHGANAKEAGLPLRPTVVLVFGNPKVGTLLMQGNQAFALDLPLRLAIWQDEQGRTWVGYHDLQRVAAGYGMEGDATVQKLAGFMANLAKQSAGTP